MKFVLLVEGQTELRGLKSFLIRWLEAQIEDKIVIDIDCRGGWSNLVKDAPTRTQLHLNDPNQKNEIIAVIALLDLHGPTFAYPRSAGTSEERCAWAKKYMEQQVKHEKFRQFFAVHDVEAWLLSDPSIFPPEVGKALKRYTQPENVNSIHSPSRLLGELYWKHKKQGYRKTTDGEELFGKLDPALAYKKCPHLKAMLDEMLALAKASGL